MGLRHLSSINLNLGKQPLFEPLNFGVAPLAGGISMSFTKVRHFPTPWSTIPGRITDHGAGVNSEKSILEWTRGSSARISGDGLGSALMHGR